MAVISRTAGNELFSINSTGKGHDGSSGIRIPNQVFGALKNKFPDWNWPSDQIIELYSTNHFQFANTKFLRPVSITSYKDFSSLNYCEGFEGYFHGFADDPFVTGGSGGWKHRTVALIETLEGNIKKVPVDCVRFTDIEG